MSKGVLCYRWNILTDRCISIKLQTVPDLWSLDLGFFDFTVVLKWYPFSKNCTLNFALFSWASDNAVWYSRDGGQWHQATDPTQPQNHKSKQLIPYSVLCCQCFFGYCILSFHILSCIQNAYMCFLLLVRRWNSR